MKSKTLKTRISAFCFPNFCFRFSPLPRTLAPTMPTAFDQAFQRVKQLVSDFRANEKPQLSPAYGWSSSTPVAVLHDFEQFEILDCRYRPHIETALAQICANEKNSFLN